MGGITLAKNERHERHEGHKGHEANGGSERHEQATTTAPHEGQAVSPPSGAPPAQPADSAAHSPLRVRAAFVGLLLALLLAAQAQTVVATVLPAISADLQGADRISWVLTAHLLGATVALPLHGRLGDLYGRKGVLQFSLVVFVIGSALAGWSRTMDELIAFRALQGIGAGGLLTGVHAITADLVPARRRGRFMGLTGAALGLASVAGPLLGALLTEHASWRWNFYVPVPFALIALLVVTGLLKLPESVARGRLDILGALLLAAASTCLVLLISWGGTEHAWNSRVILGLACGAAGTILLLTVVEHYAPEPLLPLRLFRNSAFLATGLAGAVTGVALWAAAGHLPAYFRTVGGADTAETGLLMLPLMGGILVAAVISGQLISRTGHYPLYPVLGGAVSVVGMWLLSQLDADTPRLDHSVWQAVLGTGIGLVLPALVLAVQHAAPHADLGATTGAHLLVRQLGAGIGTLAVGTIVARRLTGAELSGDGAVTQAYADTTPRIFLYLVPVLALGLLIAFFLKEKPLVSHNAPAAPVPPARTPDRAHPPVPPPAPVRTAPAYIPGVPVCGTVQHHDGSCVPRAALTLIDVRGQQIGRGASGEDGRYALSVPGPGSYVMIAAAGGHQPQAVSVTVGDRPVELDVVLGGAGRLAGTVVTADGMPVRDAAVTLTDVRGDVVASTRSGREGGYVIPDLVAGEYTLAASAPAFRPAALPVSVQAARETRQDIELAGGAMLRGTVRAPGGRPVEEARVTLLDAAANVVDTLTTSADGTFRFVDLSTGEYTVIAAGYPPVATVLQVAGGGRTERDLQLGHED